MKITFDKNGNAAYIYFHWPLDPNSITKTYACDPFETGSEINLDFDTFGRLLGIEILDAKRILPDDLLRNAEIIG
jgi:uncharacterized protein YuzE